MDRAEVKLSPQAKNLQKGLYAHYKNSNKKYRVFGVAVNSETLEEMVIYQALYADEIIWARLLKIFLGEVEIKGKKAPRFRLVQSS